MDLYNELKKIDDINEIATNKIKLEIVEIPKQKQKIKAPRHRKKVKKTQIITNQDDDDDDDVNEEEITFKPKMAGQTGLPVFFFNNLVRDSRSVIMSTAAKNKMNYKTFQPKA